MLTMLKEIRQYCTFKNKTVNYKIQYNNTKKTFS